MTQISPSPGLVTVVSLAFHFDFEVDAPVLGC